MTVFTDADRAAVVEMAKIAESAERYHGIVAFSRAIFIVAKK